MAKKSFRIDLNKIENLQFAIQKYSSMARERICSTVEQWARETKGNYDALTGYGNRLQGKQSFYSVVGQNGGNGLTVSVGHEAFIARFLEVGTKAHAIPHKQGKGYAVAHVKGISGSKALAKAMNKGRRELKGRIEQEVNDILRGGA